MSALVFLLVPLAVSVLVSLVLWARHHRPPPDTSSPEAWQRGLDALAPGRSPDPEVRRRAAARDDERRGR